MKNLKKVTLVLAIVLLVSGCRTSSNARMKQMQKLIGNNECFYKGGYGIICDGLYLKKGDPSNNLYSASGTLFHGYSSTAQQLVHVKNATVPEPISVDTEHFQLPDDGIVILFTRDFVYVLDQSSKDYFKYRR